MERQHLCSVVASHVVGDHALLEGVDFDPPELLHWVVHAHPQVRRGC